MKHLVLVSFLSALCVGCSSCAKPADDGCTIDGTAVEQGWVTIPAGTFVYGSPVTEPCRGKYSEKQVEVTLTHDFRMPATEVTLGQWLSMCLPDPTGSYGCEDCPVVLVDFYEALAYCNALSEAAGLPKCYDLSCCFGTVGGGCAEGTGGCQMGACAQEKDSCEDLTYECYCDTHLYEKAYECPGYRLPTAAEWEYAARAGTTTATYNGEVYNNELGPECLEEPNVNPIAWYCYNADWPLEVAQLEPNDFGLYDILGNAQEFVDHVHDSQGLAHAEGQAGPLTDPLGEPVTSSTSDGASVYVEVRGGSVMFPGCLCRAAWTFILPTTGRLYYIGFRPVRTLL